MKNEKIKEYKNNLENLLINCFVVGFVVVVFSIAVLFCWTIAGWLMLIY